MKYWQIDNYNISAQSWFDFLHDRSVFSQHDIAVVSFIYIQPYHKATATEIGKYFDYNYRKINARNKQLSQRVLKELDKEPEIRSDGTKRFWNVPMTNDGSIPAYNKTHFYWILRENLRLALSQYLERDSIQDFNNHNPYYIEETEIFSEGKPRLRTHIIFERSPIARRKCLEYHGCICKVCGFSAEKTYGKEFAGMIHVHHLTPQSSRAKEYIINPKTDMVPLCPNCHNAVHNNHATPYTLEEVKKFLRNNQFIKRGIVMGIKELEESNTFTYRITKDNKVFISYYGKQVTVLKGKKAEDIIKKLSSAKAIETQSILAKVTGNFKRGNENIE